MSDTPDPNRGDACADPAAPAPGSVLGAAELLARLRQTLPRASRYAVGEELGRGGMGRVLAALDREVGRRVAMKVLEAPEAEAGPDPERVARFLEEAQVTGQLDHPGIVPLHELGLDDQGRLFFTMKLVRGVTLTEVFALAAGGASEWPLARALGVVLKVCEAVAFAHARGVVHRDLKPGNVMVGRFGETYVMDWGLARSGAGRPPAAAAATLASTVLHTVRDAADAGPESPLLTADGRVVGTPAFMAPEQAEGAHDRITSSVDVYAAGALVYQLLTGAPPYTRPGSTQSPRTILARVLAGPPPPIVELNPRAPADLVAIAERAMARDPAHRYPTTLALAADIEAFLDRRPVRARQRWHRSLLLAVVRHRAVAATTAVALVVLVALAAWFVVRLAAARRAEERLADLMAARVLLAEDRDSLTPLVPPALPATQRWLQRAETVLGRAATHRADVLAGVDPTPLSRDEADELLVASERLAARHPAVAAAASLAEQMLAPPDAATAALWRQVFVDFAADPRFASLAADPQPGLLPLARNEAGFWQFLLLGSGEPPKFAAGGQLAPVDEATGVVFVLLPGGDIELGWNGSGVEAATENPERPERNERVRRAVVPPFLLAAHELTQGQWRRATGLEPARRRMGTVANGVAWSGANPVESVSWYEVRRVAALWWVRLPSEAELEYAGRAASPTLPWFDGRRATELEGRENLCDESCRRQGGAVLPWNDGHQYHAPVGSFTANSFGLYDLAGNVAEWTADFYGSEEPDRSGPADAELPDHLRLRVVKGAAWGTPPGVVRASYRQFYRPDYVTHWVGARLARSWSGHD